MKLLVALFIALTEAKKGYNAERSRDIDPSKVDVFPETFKSNVPFGQIYKEGFWDPNGQWKQPIDLLEVSMVVPDKKENIEELIKKGVKFQLIKTEKPSVFINPRDAYVADHKIEREDDKTESKNDVNMTRPLWLDLAAQQHRNSLTPPTTRVFPKRRDEVVVKENAPMKNPDAKFKQEFFSGTSFDLINSWRTQQINWTTCKEFAKGASFHPKDIVDIEWVPFYIWSNRYKTFCDVHKFTYPPLKLVKYFRETYGSNLMKKVDWNQPTLLMNGTGEWLLVAADRNGLFHAIPRHVLPNSIKNMKISFPIITMRIKVVDPYLAYMLCDEPYASIMAVAGNEPPNDKAKELEASGLGFRGIGAPVTRDLELERKLRKMQMEDAIQRERRKYIDVRF